MQFFRSSWEGRRGRMNNMRISVNFTASNTDFTKRTESWCELRLPSLLVLLFCSSSPPGRQSICSTQDLQSYLISLTESITLQILLLPNPTSLPHFLFHSRERTLASSFMKKWENRNNSVITRFFFYLFHHKWFSSLLWSGRKKNKSKYNFSSRIGSSRDWLLMQFPSLPLRLLLSKQHYEPEELGQLL